MKKLLFAFAAGLLLLAGCAKEYDDTALKEKVQAIDKKVDALQAEVDKLKGDVTALQTIINEWKSGGLITKIEDAKEGGVVVGKTITFLGGKTVTIFNGKDGKDGQDGSSPVIGVKEDAGVLYWTVNGEYLISGGKKVPVNVVPSFEIKEGHLWVTINGVAQDLGSISGGAPVDSLIKSIVETETTVVITLNTVPEKVIEIPLAKPFGFVFESTDFAVLSADPINIPYTLNGKTDKTTVGVFTNANYTAEIDAEKVVVTPPAAGVKGEVLVWAANHEGQSDIAKLTFGPVQSEKTDPAPEDPEGKYEDDVDYIAEAVSGAVEAHVTANVDIAVKSEAEWITVGEITKAAYTINLTLQDNPNDIIRYGNVKVVLKSNEEVVLQTFKIAQAAGQKKEAEGVWVLDISNPAMQTRVDYAGDALKQLTNYTYEIRFFANSYNKLKNGWCRRLACISNENEQNGFLIRFGDGNSAVGKLKINGLVEAEIGDPFTAGEWVTLSFTGDGTNVYIYKNGEQIYTAANNKKLDANSIEIGMSYADGSNVANSYPYGQYFDGYIDYVRVWNVTRSQAEIKAGLCDVAKDAAGLAAYWKIEDKAKPAGVFPDVTGHGYDMNFAKTHRANAWKDADPANVDVSAIVAEQWFDYTETICVPPEPTPEPINFDPDNFAALDWSNKEAAAWYKFAENYALPDGFTYIIHIYPYTLNTKMSVGKVGKKDEKPCNMLRFGENGNNAELEWAVDHGTGRSQKELLAPGFKVNKWQAVVLTADKATGEYKIYRNDELKASKTFTYNDAMGFGAIEFANSWSASYRSAFNGRIALISVYDKALSADEIKDNIFAVPVSENCVGFWPMIEGEGGLLKADQTRAIKEDIDLTKMTRSADESDHYEVVDVTGKVTWTTGNKIEPELPPVPDPATWKVDAIDMAFTGVTSGTSYSSWSGKQGSTSEAVYAGQSASNNGKCIQLRSNNNNSGIISTTSGGKVKKVEITFNSQTTDRIVSVYGKNETAYASPSDLYNANNQGTLLGEIQAGTDEYALYVQGDYEYIGLRSKSGSIYIDQIKISWEPIPQLPDNLQEGLAPDFKQMMFNVTFPDELNHTDEVTFEGWVYAKSFSGAQANLPTFMGVENSILVRFNQNGVPEYLLGDQMTGGGEVKATNSSFRLSTNQWYHVAATYKRNDKMYLYVNAEEVASNNTKDYPVELNTGVSGNDDSVIGRKFYVGNAFSTRWFTGNMSHIRIWKKALTAEEIKASANNKLLMTDPDLIANWPLTDKEGIAVTDLSGNELSTKFVTYSTASGVADAENVVREDVNVPDLIFAESLKLNKTALDLMRGDQETLIVSVVPSNALVPSISWESSDANIASVSGGLVTAKGVGEATITAKATVNGSEIKAECAVTVTGLTGAVAPYMKENYFRTMGGYGSMNVITVEWKMKGKNFDAPTVSSVFGREGQWLLRIGDEGIEKNELQLATNHGNWTTGVKFDTDKWYHVAVTYSTETQNAQIYVNGAMVAENPGFATAAANLTGTTSTTVSRNSNPYTNDVNIGASYFDRTGSYGNYKAVNNRWFDGQMCELRVWSVVRSADEISANMDNLEDTSSENLKAYYKMDLTDANNGDGRTIKDYSTAGKDLTCGAAEAIWQQGRENIGNN